MALAHGRGFGQWNLVLKVGFIEVWKGKGTDYIYIYLYHKAKRGKKNYAQQLHK